MIIVFLKFSKNKSQAPTYMKEHNSWLKQGFEDGVFHMAGSIQPAEGGAIIVHSLSLEETKARVETDPFVEHGVVTAEFIEVSPSITSENMSFLIQNTEG